MWKVIGDKYMYLTYSYYVHFGRVKGSDGLQECTV